MRFKAWLAAVLLIAATLAALPEFQQGPALIPLPQAKRDVLSTAEQVTVTHPAFTGSLGNVARRGAYLAYARHLADGLRAPVTYTALLEAEDLLLQRLHDPHSALTELWLPDTNPDLLPVGFYWAADGLVAYRVEGSPAALQTGDRVISIGGLDDQRLLRRMRRYFSGNLPWLKTLAGEELPLGNTLRWFGVVQDDAVRLELERPSGRRYTLAVPLVPQSLAADDAYTEGRAAFAARYLAPQGMAEPQGGRPYAWRLTPDYGIFWLTSSLDTSGYRKAVDRFFKAVRSAGVYYVVIDLAENPGGYATVANPLLRHLPLRPAMLGDVPAAVRAQNPAEVFRGKVYVLIDGGSMSAAVYTAEMLSEWGEAELVGQPAGMATGAFVGPKTFLTPDRRVAYQVSTTFLPAVDGVQAASLQPAVALPVTVRDIQRGVDPVANWLSDLATPRVKT